MMSSTSIERGVNQTASSLTSVIVPQRPRFVPRLPQRSETRGQKSEIAARRGHRAQHARRVRSPVVSKLSFPGYRKRSFGGSAFPSATWERGKEPRGHWVAVQNLLLTV